MERPFLSRQLALVVALLHLRDVRDARQARLVAEVLDRMGRETLYEAGEKDE